MATHRFVKYGYGRLQAAARPEILKQVLAEFATQLDEARGWRWVWLRYQVSLEVEHRLERIAPPDALY
ncbi:MAG TPA: hypothetical protein VMF30_10575 [Pirellulales bacterium]|nr:hypothetical protein [Pirellulales bacterium]